ncbi:MAG: hypothetical protein GF364_22685 [Candidatus Lokiarchaeota archaeon]|nr:hypothetical protein [Candidatus Lokiarchaeota archaeon]
MVDRPAGQVRIEDAPIAVTFVLDVNAYASGDLMAQPVKLEGVAYPDSRVATLMSVVVYDADDQGENLTVCFTGDIGDDIGTLNSAPSLSDAQSEKGEGFVQVTTWEDLGSCQQGCEDAVGLMVETDENGDLWVWLLSKGAGTYASGEIKAKFYFVRS